MTYSACGEACLSGPTRASDAYNDDTNDREHIDSRAAPETARGMLTTASRFAAALLGGYLFAYGLTALATFGGYRAGLDFTDAKTLAWMLAILAYLGSIVWGFAARSLVMAWVSLAGGGAVMSLAAWTLSRWLAAGV